MMRCAKACELRSSVKAPTPTITNLEKNRMRIARFSLSKIENGGSRIGKNDLPPSSILHLRSSIFPHHSPIHCPGPAPGVKYRLKRDEKPVTIGRIRADCLRSL